MSGQIMELTPWRNALSLPITRHCEDEWRPNDFESVLMNSFKQCVRACMENNSGKIAMLLSGGIDSSVFLAMARKIAGPEASIYAFTIAGSKEHPDYKFSKIAAKKFGAIHHVFIPDNGSVENAKRVMSRHWPSDPFFRGDDAVFLLFQYISGLNRALGLKIKAVLTFDGIDELLGGYPRHRMHDGLVEMAEEFRKSWGELDKKHITPLIRTANRFEFEVIFPYLQEEVINFISGIPLRERTSREESKIPLRRIARRYYLPEEIVNRRKRGFCDALKKE